MSLKCVLFVICFIVLDIRVSTCLKASIEVHPPVIKRGSYAVLQCIYDLEGEPLYTVKWYRGRREFFRYSPNDTPMNKVFLLPGVHVDLSMSNASQVMLRNMEFAVAGSYSCEVSADAPTFHTTTVTTQVDVIAPPESGPVIHAEQAQYAPGDMLQANCSTGPARPGVNLTFLLNEQILYPSSQIIRDVDDLKWSQISVVIPLNEGHFVEGHMTLRCVAKLNPVYIESATATYVAPVDPKSERITSGDEEEKKPQSSGRRVQETIILILLSSMCSFLSLSRI